MGAFIHGERKGRKREGSFKMERVEKEEEVGSVTFERSPKKTRQRNKEKNLTTPLSKVGRDGNAFIPIVPLGVTFPLPLVEKPRLLLRPILHSFVFLAFFFSLLLKYTTQRSGGGRRYGGGG